MMDFLGEVFIRLLLAGALFAGCMGAVTGASENIRGISCVVIIFSTILYMVVEVRTARSGK